MAIPRGSINHEIVSDFRNYVRTFFDPKICKKANNKTINNLRIVLSNIFPDTYFSFLPFARTSFYATLKALDIKEGSEILMTPFNISPMVNILDNLRIKPLFIDINLNDFGPNYETLEYFLKKKNVKCFLLTYLFGYVPDLDLILDLCKKYDVVLIEDISQNIGAKFKNQLLGTFGEVAFYSSSLTKYIDTYNGSFLISKNKNIYSIIENFVQELSSPSKKRIQSIILRTLIWNFSLNRYIFSLFTYPTLFIISKFAPNIFNNLIGPSISIKRSNYLPNFYFESISEIQAKVMIKEIKKLNSLLSSRRKSAKLALNAMGSNSDYFFNSFQVFKNQYESNYLTFWQFIIRVKNTSIQKKILFSNRIETGITNLPNLAEIYNVKLKNATLLKEQYIFLPLHNYLKLKEYRRIFQILMRNI